MSSRSQASSSKEYAHGIDEDWSVWEDGKLRKRLQNRLNQRAMRQRKAEREEPLQLAYRMAVADPKRPLPANDDRAKKTNDIQNPFLEIPKHLDFLWTISPSLETPFARKMFYIAYAIIWPSYGQGPTRAHEPLGMAMFKSCTKEPIILDTCIANIAKMRLRTVYHPDDMKTMCEAQTRVTQGLRKSLADGVISDAVLFGIAALGFEVCESEPGQEQALGLFKSVGIEHLGGLNEMGHFRWAPKHYDVGRRLLAERGGINTVTCPGMEESLSNLDLMNTWETLSAPELPLCQRDRSILDEDMPRVRPPAYEAQAFRVDDDFKEVLLDLRLVCRMIHKFCEESKDQFPEYGQLVQYRDIVQHRILSLPRGNVDTEICRLAVTVFAYGVIYPLPRRSVLDRVTEMLTDALRDERCREGQDKALLFWATMLGAIASRSDTGTTNLERFYRRNLRALIQTLRLRNWEAAKMMLQQFIWLDIACDVGARAVWLRCQYDEDESGS